MAFPNAGQQQQRQPSSSVATNDGRGAHHNMQFRLDLEREGRCPDCGIQTHRLHQDQVKMASTRSGPSPAVIVRKEPLTIDKVVYHGRCLICRPFTSTPSTLCDGRGSSIGFSAYANQVAPQVIPQAPAPQLQPQLHSISVEEEPDADGGLQQEAHSNNGAVVEDESDNDDEEILSILLRMRHCSPQDLALQISCLHSLWVLSWETENSRAIGRVGGIPIILESLNYHLQAHLSINNRYNRNNHTSSPSAVQRMQLQANGLATLQNLSVNKINKELLVENNSTGVPLILLSISTFLHNAEIVSSGCNALANILSNGTCYRMNILNHGGLNVVLRAVEHHKENEGVVRCAYKTLCLLGQKSTARREFRRMESGDMTDDEGSENGKGNGEEGGEDEGEDSSMYDMDTSARSALSTYSDHR